MKKTKTKYLTRVSSLAMGVGLLASSGLATTTSVFAASQYEGTYGVDHFASEYSRGIAYRVGNIGISESDSPISMTHSAWPTEGEVACRTADDASHGTRFFCNNHARMDSVYVTFERAAILDGKYLDIREYIWSDVGEWSTYLHETTKNAVVGALDAADPKPGTIYRELHFYEAGTTKEVSFKGVISFYDSDEGEGCKFNTKNGFKKGYILPAGETYMNPATTKTESDGSVSATWTGRETINAKGTQLWVEVSGSSSNPLKFEEILNEHSGIGSGTEFRSVSYDISDASTAGVTVPTPSIVVENGTLSPLPTPTLPSGYTLTWYTDATKTTKAGGSIEVNKDDVTLYGKLDQKSSGGEEGGEGEDEKEDEDGKDESTDKKDSTIATPDTGSSTSNPDGLSGGKAMIVPILLVSLAALLGTGFAIKAKSKKKVMKFGR